MKKTSSLGSITKNAEAEVNDLRKLHTQQRSLSSTRTVSVVRSRYELNRSYGFFKTFRSSVFYPKTPETNLEQKMISFNKEVPEPVTEPALTFEMRRKLFDKAEFTICKGIKLSTSLCSIPSDQQENLRQDLLKMLRERQSSISNSQPIR